MCSASNGVGKIQERTISLEVEFPPKIEVPKPKVPQAAYYEAHLLCEIQVKFKDCCEFCTFYCGQFLKILSLFLLIRASLKYFFWVFN